MREEGRLWGLYGRTRGQASRRGFICGRAEVDQEEAEEEEAEGEQEEKYRRGCYCVCGLKCILHYNTSGEDGK